jgi:hypothetical protein
MSKDIREMIDRVKNFNECNFFNIKTTGMPFYDDIIKNINNRENIEYKIVNLSIDDYFKLIRDESGISYTKEYHLNNISSVLGQKIIKIMEEMKSGVKYDIPVYDFRDGFQEGRHRLIAVNNLGCDHAPIALFGYNIDMELKKLGINTK